MNKSWRHRLRRLRFVCGGLICAALIAVAVLVGLVQVLLPLAAQYPDRVASLLSSRLHQPVKFASLDGHWQPSGPLLVLHDVRIGGGSGSPLRLPVANVKIDLGALLRPRRRLVNLRLEGLRMDLTRAANGRWSVAGFGAAGRGGSQPPDLEQLPGNLWLDDLRMNITDAASGHSWHLLADRLRLSNGGGVLRFAGSLRRPGVTHALRLAGRVDQRHHAGTLYLGGTDIDLGKLLAGVSVRGHAVTAGQGDLQLWLGWRDAQVTSQALHMNLNGLALRSPAGEAHIDHAQAMFDFRQVAGGLRFRYASANGGIARVDVHGSGAAHDVVARARGLRLQNLLPWIAQVPGLPASLGPWLLKARPRGQIRHVAMRWSAAHGIEHLDADFAHLAFAPVGHRPGIDSVDGRLLGDRQAVSLQLPEQAATLRMPGTFRKPVVLSGLKGDLALWRQDGNWHAGTGGLNFQGPGFAGQARGQVRLDHAGGKPFMDVFVAMQQVDLRAARQFLPVNAIPAHTLKWLDGALDAGKLTRADVVLHGNLADWPFRGHQGRFEARGVISGLTFDFNPHWPRAEGVDAVASFVDDGMLVKADAGGALGIQVKHAVASIASFHDPQLVLSAQGSASGASMLDFVRKSPIAAANADALRALKLGGKGDFDFSLVLPFQDGRPFTLAGSDRITNMDVTNPDWGLSLGKLEGVLRFDGHGMRGSNLQATWQGVPSQMDLALGSGATGDPAQSVRVDMRGRYSLANLVQGRPSLEFLADVAHGQADFDIGFDIRHDAAGDLHQTLHVDSDLQGIALDLPAPLDKSVSGRLPLHLTLQLPVGGGDLHVALGTLAHAWARLPGEHGEPLALAVMLGNSAPRKLPASGIRVRGHANRLDVSGWMQRGLALGGSGSGGLGLDSVDVSSDHAQLFGAGFRQMHLLLKPQPKQVLLRVDSPGIEGTLTYPTEDLQRRGIVAKMQRLYWPDNSAEAKKAAKPTTPPQAIDYAATGIDPGALPPLHFSVDDLRLGKAHLGQARLESWPTAKGMHIDQLRTHTSDVQIMATGDWNGDAVDSHTHMNIDFGAENLGSLLNTLGFSGLFEGGRTHVHLDARWPGEPSALALERMRGTLSVQVGKGRIPEVQPGMGRLLGLMAVTELPRRLSLDFGDVFGKGFGFDSIKGHFKLADGVASTSDLKLKGSSAEISFSGSTNLREKTYDQRILVVPHLGNSLPVVGALAGGPLGAAAGLAVQGLLGKGLNKAASARYSLTGSWSKPKMTRLDKKGLQPAPAATTPPPHSPPHPP